MCTCSSPSFTSPLPPVPHGGGGGHRDGGLPVTGLSPLLGFGGSDGETQGLLSGESNRVGDVFRGGERELRRQVRELLQ